MNNIMNARNSVMISPKLLFVYDQTIREGHHRQKFMSFVESRWALMDDFYPWCAERKVVLNHQTDKEGLKTGMMTIVYPNDNTKMEFKLRWQ